MAGNFVPVVMWPRYSAFTGAASFTTLGMDVTEFQNAFMSVWRSGMPTGATFALNFEESMDQVVWTPCNGVGLNVDPGSSETQYIAQLKKRWFRLRLDLGGSVLAGTVPVATCWAAGFLESRES